jgi:signal transduction histidine kinase
MHLQVKDNGKGFTLAGIKKGNGLRNMEERAADMNALIEIDSIIGTGTTIKIKAPIT